MYDRSTNAYLISRFASERLRPTLCPQAREKTRLFHTESEKDKKHDEAMDLVDVAPPIRNLSCRAQTRTRLNQPRLKLTQNPNKPRAYGSSPPSLAGAQITSPGPATRRPLRPGVGTKAAVVSLRKTAIYERALMEAATTATTTMMMMMGPLRTMTTMMTTETWTKKKLQRSMRHPMRSWRKAPSLPNTAQEGAHRQAASIIVDPDGMDVEQESPKTLGLTRQR